MNVPTQSSTPVHVAAAVIVNAHGEVLISLRAAHVHQGGLWEFPGGKVEPGENAYAALCRELLEELGIGIEAARPLIRIPHAYPDKRVLLDVWRVTSYAGTARGCEGQTVAWVAPSDLPGYEFPAANRPIIAAAQLPDRYLITPEPESDFLPRLEQALAAGIDLVQLRAKALGRSAYTELAREVCRKAHAHRAQVLLNADPALVQEVGADGVHLTSERLMGLSGRPLPKELWVAASCHSATELAQAARCGCDFAVAGPVRPTRSHPGWLGIGWPGLRAFTEAAPLPVYALGGLDARDMEAAWAAGAQGVAAIRGFWPEAM